MIEQTRLSVEAWHGLPVDDAVLALESDARLGLDEHEARARLELFGPNELPQKNKRSVFLIFMGQFKDLMIGVLIVAALVSGVLLKEYLDAGAIGAILLINAVLGFVQELRAEAAMESLQELASPKATVLRGGQEETVPARALVPGDVILLAAGDVVPADCRLIETAALQIDESSLTGESVPVHKETDRIEALHLSLGDRTNLAYLGTTVQAGRGKGVVFGTGTATEMGKIANLIEVGEDMTPLQRELQRVGRVIAFIVLGVALAVFLAGVATGKPSELMFLAAVSLAVAAIPEGLPAAVTITLALGVKRMAAVKAIIRRLHAVETLGSTTFIATDKTGTLTKNQMAVRALYLAESDQVLSLTGSALIVDDQMRHLLRAAMLVNDAHRTGDRLVGDPTETALIVAGEALGIDQEALSRKHPRLDEVPFDSSRKLMSTLHADDEEFVLFAKGAPEMLLGRASLSENERRHVEDAVDAFARKGLRTLAIAQRRFRDRPLDLVEEERELTIIGLAALVDPPRAEVVDALATCRRAGIRVAMITGDHAATALAIGDEIGLTNGGTAITGAELEVLSTDEIADRIQRVSVFARVDPSHKVKIVEALKARREIVAMTGDGVNDGPALKKADIGVAMGATGTQVAKEASDMILADDNFATIVAAIQQGRLIFENLKKFIHFLLSCNVSEVLTMFFITIVGLPLPLFPVQLLWINLITDGFPALALGVDPASGDLMERRPRGPEDGIVAPAALKRLFLWGFILTVGTIGAFVGVLLVHGVPLLSVGNGRYAGPLALARTATFTAMVLQQLVHALSFRSGTRTVFSPASLKNRSLTVAVGISAALQLGVIYLPVISGVFHTQPLGVADWGVVLAAILAPILAIDYMKRSATATGRASANLIA
ncbi:MAG: cation-translocating P-type ATPase [Chloroflexi bacterium]|nr:cation-translocating P-type ATPase [Chloroflexota bacterium]